MLWENVKSETDNSAIGAQISIIGTTEKSTSITGTNDWQELEFLFDSKNRDTLEIGFRLGGNETNTKGIGTFNYHFFWDDDTEKQSECNQEICHSKSQFKKHLDYILYRTGSYNDEIRHLLC